MKPIVRSLSKRQRGSTLLVALLLAAGLAIGLTGYLALTRNSLNVAQRTFNVRDALGLAEAGLEEVLDSFHQVEAGVATATAWSSWTLSGVNATRTLTPFNRDGRAIATVKIFVSGYDGSTSTPLAISQVTLVPFDGTPPIVRTVQVSLSRPTNIVRALVARQGLNFVGQASANSYNSNPTGSPTGPWARYTPAAARNNTLVIVPAGTISLGAQTTIGGNVMVGTGVTPPPQSKVTGTITTGFTGSFPLPTYPSAATVSQSYNLGASLPATLPVPGHLPAADGRYYYFCSNATIANVSITANKAVTIVGSTTQMSAGLNVQSGASLSIYIDGAINSSNNGINNSSWAGALQVFTSTSLNCNIGGNGQMYGCVYAPNAALILAGGGSTGMVVGSFVARTISSSGHMEFHYDEALQPASAGSLLTVTGWYELSSAADRASLASLTSNFLR